MFSCEAVGVESGGSEDVGLPSSNSGTKGSECSRTKWDEFDVVFLAALAGMDTKTKIGILRSLARQLKAGTVVVARSARDVRGMIYPVSLISSFETIG